MHWIEIRRALLYGQPQIPSAKVQPQAVRTAVREIVRLIHFGWIEDLTEETLQRIQAACDIGQCKEIWDQFPRPRKAARQPKRKKNLKKTAR